MATKRNRLHYIPTHLCEKKKNLKKRKKEKKFYRYFIRFGDMFVLIYIFENIYYVKYVSLYHYTNTQKAFPVPLN